MNFTFCLSNLTHWFQMSQELSYLIYKCLKALVHINPTQR